MAMRKSKDESLKRVAIQIVAQLPSNKQDAQAVLLLAIRLLEKVEEPWKPAKCISTARALASV